MSDTEALLSGPEPGTDRAASRRTMLRGAALMCLTAPVLVACGGTTATTTGNKTAGASTTQTPSSADVVATTADVPEGGGVVVGEAGVVLTQPAAGEYKCFSNICTHQSCPVDNVSGGTINCLCHGSKFSIKDGSVANGPATSPLPEKAITVDGKDISLA